MNTMIVVCAVSLIVIPIVLYFLLRSHAVPLDKTDPEQIQQLMDIKRLKILSGKED